MSALPAVRKLSIREAMVVRSMEQGGVLGTALRDAGWGDWAQHHSGQWLQDHPDVAMVLDSIRDQILIDAEEVLRELVSNYAGLLVQETRLQSMLGHDIAELYDERGNVKAIASWPEKWRTMLVVEIESRESSERSHDGTTEDKQGGWDKTGELKKVKRESTLAIEKELRDCKRAQVDCLKVIGNHVKVKAFPQQGDQNIKISITVTAEEQREMASAARRRSKVIDVAL